MLKKYNETIYEAFPEEFNYIHYIIAVESKLKIVNTNFSGNPEDTKELYL